jgi:hypothetical protein
MTLQLSLPAELEDQLRRRAAEQGVNIEKFVEEAVIDRLDAAPEPVPGKRSHEELLRALDDIIALHPRISGHVDDSRESIYAGRGE